MNDLTTTATALGFLDFNDAAIPVLLTDEGRWPSVTALCNEMGVDSNGQRQLIERKHWSQGWTCKTHVQVPGDSQRREHFFIHEKRVPMWLANIDTSRLRDDEVRARVEDTQVRFADVLAEWVATGEVKPNAVIPAQLSKLEILRMALESEEQREQERTRADAAEARVSELEPMAEGYRHFLEKDGTVKWANACEYLGVAPNLFGAYLRSRKVTYADEYFVERKGKQVKRQGERHNRPYGDYKHWFSFPAYDESEKLDRVPGHKQFDRRVTKAGMEGLRRGLKRHVIECGQCSMCDSVRKAKPERYAEWRPTLRAIEGGASA